ncbi:MAG TPA: hypothetical protein VGD37_26300 [Kofleriaceae bacterium]|jgi:hypothetical protein
MMSAGPAWADEPAAPGAPGPLSTKDQLARVEAELAAQRAEIAAQRAALDRDRREIDDLRAASDIAAEPAVLDVSLPTFRLYGFIDMGFQKLWTADDPVVPTLKTTFVLGNVNMYFDFHPVEDWSSLVEVRFTNYPNGTESAGIPLAGVDYHRIDTSAADPGNGEGYDLVKWGGIVLERAYIQWQHDEVGFRVGQFLTPYGIWNVDHGTPTLISLLRPQFVSRELWPSQQLGAEVFGRLDHMLPERWGLEYHAYVSNGRTPGVVDLTEDKMLGGRLVASTTSPHPMAFGLSFMHGSYSDQQHNIDLMTDSIVRPEVIAYTESGVAADASIDLGALRLRSEITLRRIDYENGKRETSFAAPNSYVPDSLQTDVYALMAYRIPNTRFEPYLYFEAYHVPTPIGDLMAVASAGLNVYFTPSVQLKLQYSHTRWLYTDDLSVQSDVHDFTAGKFVMAF